MKLSFKTAAPVLAAIFCILWPAIAACAPNQIADDATLWDAICPIVYPVDQSASCLLYTSRCV